MSKKHLTDKILIVLDGLIKESLAFMYPYKGIGYKFKKYEGSFSQALYKLKSNGYLEIVEENNQKYIKMTPKGKLKIIGKRFSENWDGFWRIIAFDVEEKRKKTRDVFRRKLQELKCLPIQKSVWLTPYDISSELEDLLDVLDLNNNVDYFIAKAMTNKEKYIELFNLKKT